MKLGTLQGNGLAGSCAQNGIADAIFYTNYLEVLTARQNLLNAELTQAQDKFDEMQRVVSLYHALGGGRYFKRECGVSPLQYRVSGVSVVK